MGEEWRKKLILSNYLVSSAKISVCLSEWGSVVWLSSRWNHLSLFIWLCFSIYFLSRTAKTAPQISALNRSDLVVWALPWIQQVWPGFRSLSPTWGTSQHRSFYHFNQRMLFPKDLLSSQLGISLLWKVIWQRPTYFSNSLIASSLRPSESGLSQVSRVRYLLPASWNAFLT